MICENRNGAQGRNRTTDTRIFSPLLYQLSYLGRPSAGAGRLYRKRCVPCPATPSFAASGAFLAELGSHSYKRPTLAKA
jgi:hypothetical protein